MPQAHRISAAPATGKRAIDTHERMREVLLRRRAGATLQAIANDMNISKTQVHRYIARGLESYIAEPAAELRKLEADRLDALQLAHWRDAMGATYRLPDGTSRTPTLEEKDRATRTVLSVMERRAKLLGLDQPRELKIALEAGQVDFLESAVRALVEGFFSALATAGHESAAADVHETIYGQVIPRALEAASARGVAP